MNIAVWIPAFAGMSGVRDAIDVMLLARGLLSFWRLLREKPLRREQFVR
jgi:hypothetical protein